MLPLRKTDKDAGPAKGKPLNMGAIDSVLASRSSEELILAFAGPIGCGISLVIKETKLALESINYEVHVIKLSRFIEKSVEDGAIELDQEAYADYSEAAIRFMLLQDGGNELRKKGGSILAECAIQDIVLHRGVQAANAGHTEDLKDYAPKRIAYLIDQVKHQDEVSLLRTVYGKLFHLIGVISVSDKRKARLIDTDRVRAADVSMLMERDRRQEDSNGQQLDKALQMADFFVSNDRGTTPSLQKKVRRFIGLLHNENGITPTSQEYGMYVAYAAGLKSACLSRQVGAAISDSSGKIVSTGCNDVPKAMGGLYSPEDQDKDRRCVHNAEQICFNDREKKTLKNDIEQALRSIIKAPIEGQAGPSERLIPDDEVSNLLDVVYKASNIESLIEFSRAVHAEMDAIISLARAGTPGIQGANLYTTTFPCHSCARHIVAAGIAKVYYIEPYEKSLAQKLHGDAIAFETEDDEGEREAGGGAHSAGLVRFIHFEGVAPRQYLNFFKMTKRKDDFGKVITIAPINAPKAVGEYLDDYFAFEAKVVQHLNDALPTAKTTV